MAMGDGRGARWWDRAGPPLLPVWGAMSPGLPVQAWLSEKLSWLFLPRRPALPGWVGGLWGKKGLSWLGLPQSPGSRGG